MDCFELRKLRTNLFSFLCLKLLVERMVERRKLCMRVRVSLNVVN